MCGAGALLDSLKTFDRLLQLGRGFESSASVAPVRGHRGGIITMHRSMAHFTLRGRNLVSALFVLLLFSLAWLVWLPRVCALWWHILAVGIRYLPLRADLLVASHRLTSGLIIQVPYLSVPPAPPTPLIWATTLIVVIALFCASYLFPSDWAPVAYLLRGLLFVQGTALAYFALLPAKFPHSPASYLGGLSTSALALISVVPSVFGITYYIFDFDLKQKAALTFLTMAHLTLFVPLQLILHALVLQVSVLFMPVLYIAFGVPLDVLIIVSFYAWGMSWQTQRQVATGR